MRFLMLFYPKKILLNVVTDRACEIERYCSENQINHIRINEVKNNKLSHKITNYFDDIGNIDVVLLFFLRIITKELFLAYPTLNIHPSLLPNFLGFNPIKQALKAGASNIGGTIHMVDDNVDNGNVIAQVSCPIPHDITEEEANSLSFCQKTYLVLLIFSALNENILRFKVDDIKKEFSPIWQTDRIDCHSKPFGFLDLDLEREYQNKIKHLGHGKWILPIKESEQWIKLHN